MNVTEIERGEVLNEVLILQDAGKFEAASVIIEKLLILEPDNVKLLTIQAGLLGLLENYEEAIVYYDRVLVIEPENIEALEGKAIAVRLQSIDNDEDKEIILSQELLIIIGAVVGAIVIGVIIVISKSKKTGGSPTGAVRAFCGGCGTDIDPKFKFCKKCGKALPKSAIP